MDERYLNVSGDAMTGTLDMGRQQITNASSLAFCKNPNYSSLPLMTITNYYNILYVRGASTLSLEGAIRAPAFELTENMFSLKCIQHAYDGAVLGTNYIVSLSTPTNVMNEIRVTGHLNMQGSAISNAVFVGSEIMVSNILVTGGAFHQEDGLTIDHDQIVFSGASSSGELVMGNETNLIVGTRQLLGDWSASGLRVPQQGDISMGTYTNGTF